MDSYSSYRDSARSPAERGWSNRDDLRIKDERGDPFYRPRSPGPDRLRRRSRSPGGNVDRYEPRIRRDDYGGGRDRDRDRERERDRDDRSRRVGSPPGNIDRYIPGQEPVVAQPMVNPITDPLKLPYQVGFSYFSEWWRANEKIREEKERLRTGRRREPERLRGPRELQDVRDQEKPKIQFAYDTYKEELQGKMAQSFVKQHKDEQWFRERYVPEIRDVFRQKLTAFRRSTYGQWEQDLETGTFDDFSLEGVPKSEGFSTVDKEEGEATAASEVLGVSDLVPASSADMHNDSLFQPTLLIKTIAPSVSRQNLEAFCKEHLGEEEGGFKWLSLSDPNPSKRFHRIGWIMLHPAPEASAAINHDSKLDEDDGAVKSPVPVASTADRALEAINGKTVKDEQRGDFTCHVGVHNPPTNPRKKALWDLFSAPERIEKDLELVRRLVNKFEEEYGSDFNAILKIEERVEDLQSTGRLHAAVSSSGVKRSRKERLTIGLDEAMDEDAEQRDDGEEELEEEEGMVDDEVDDESIVFKKKQLDMMIEYLRRVFHFCFFCVFESDSIHELTRKCPGGHLRRPRSTLSSSAKAVARASALGEPFPARKRQEAPAEELEEGEAPDPAALAGGDQRKFRASKSEQQLQRAYNWVKTFEDKILQILEPESVNLRKLGGKPIEDAVNEELVKYVKQEDEHKWRCKVPECSKLFKEDHFWKKHVEKRHTEWLDKLKEEFELTNAYVLDPAHIAPSRTDANSNGHFPPTNGQQPTGTPRGFNLQQYAMNSMMPFTGFSPMAAMFGPNMMNAAGAMGNPAAGGWHGAGAPGAVGQGTGGAGEERAGSGPIRTRGGTMGGGNRFQSRVGPYDRRPNNYHNPRWNGGYMDSSSMNVFGGPGAFNPMMGMGMGGGMGGGGGGGGGRGGRGGGGAGFGGAFANRWGDGAAGGAAMGPREAVQGRTIKSYEDLDQVSSGGGGELNY